MSDLETYKQLVELKKHIKIFDELYQFSGEDKMRLQRGAIPTRIAKIEDAIGYFVRRTVPLNYGAYCAAIREARSNLRATNGRATRLQEIIDQGLSLARTQVNYLYNNHSFSTVTSSQPSLELKTTHYGDHTLGIPPSWLRTVSDKGLASVSAGDGYRFIMSAKPRVSPQLDNELYQVVALKKNTGRAARDNGSLVLEGGWVARADGVSAYSTEFKKAQSLLNRRVRAKIMKAFTGE